MKRNPKISFLLAALILLTQLSLRFSVHYCQDQIASISFQPKESEPCLENVKSCCAHLTDHKPCCSDKEIKIEKKTEASILSTFQTKCFLFVGSTEWRYPINLVQSIRVVSPSIIASIATHPPPRYKLYCQFLHYA